MLSVIKFYIYVLLICLITFIKGPEFSLAPGPEKTQHRYCLPTKKKELSSGGQVGKPKISLLIPTTKKRPEQSSTSFPIASPAQWLRPAFL